MYYCGPFFFFIANFFRKKEMNKHVTKPHLKGPKMQTPKTLWWLVKSPPVHKNNTSCFIFIYILGEENKATAFVSCCTIKLTTQSHLSVNKWIQITVFHESFLIYKKTDRFTLLNSLRAFRYHFSSLNHILPTFFTRFDVFMCL